MVEILLYPVIYTVIIIASYLSVVALRRWSRRRGLFDVPNERSSHTAPTPRGGGAVIVLICLTAYTLYTFAVGGNFAWGYVAGAILIASVSWLDDLYTVSFGWRLTVHLVAAALVVVSNGYFGAIYTPLIQKTIVGEVGGAFLTFLWIVWMTNAYNFMDGIDGIAGLQTVAAGAGWMIAGHWLGLPLVSFYGGAIACAGLGFLIENWQPAKIFMGDVGSAFLGYTFAVMPLLANSEITTDIEIRRFLPVIALAFNWLFVFDTLFTVAGRAIRREKIWEAHRGHIYQRMVIAGCSHQTVTIIYGAFSGIIILQTIFWLSDREFWETILILSIGIQTVCLLVFLRIKRIN